MTTDLMTIRARAAAHQEEIDRATRFLTPQDLARRWSLSVSTIRDIPRDELPFYEFGTGRLHKRRRYAPADVAAFEARR